MQNNKIKNRKFFRFQKYNLLAFLMAIIIFALGFFISDWLNDRRFLEIDRAKQNLQIQIMGMETQLTHFRDIVCEGIGDDILTPELNIIKEKLGLLANSLGKNHPEVIGLKKHYALLQIKHYQFSKELNQRCGLKLTHLLYFYGDQRICPDCERQSQILTSLEENYDHLKIYSFDYEIELPALAIIKPVIPPEYLKDEPENRKEVRRNNIKKYLPIIVINNQPFFGFQDLEEIKKLLGLE